MERWESLERRGGLEREGGGGRLCDCPGGRSRRGGCSGPGGGALRVWARMAKIWRNLWVRWWKFWGLVVVVVEAFIPGGGLVGEREREVRDLYFLYSK